MVRRDRRFWSKVLMGCAFALLVIDVVALTCVVVPLAAPQGKRGETPPVSARLTQSVMDRALIIPTHDPRKPWVTRTPLPTATPWLIRTPASARQRPAMPVPTSDAAQVPANVSGADTAPESRAAIALATPSPATTRGEPVGAPRATLSPPATAGSAGPISLTPPPTTEIGRTETSRPALAFSAGIVPTDTPIPVESSNTPGPTQPGDTAQFETYVLDRYNTIAGQPVDIAAVTVDTTEAGQPEVVVEVLGNDKNNVFAAQSAAAALDYGRRLLADTKFYSGGQSCTITVFGRYDTSYPDACTNNPSWCTIEEHAQGSSSWSIAWTYVRGTSVDGTDDVQTWNQAP